jgi:translation initiation factor 5A
MSKQHQEVEEETYSGSMLIPSKAGSLKKGGFIQIRGHPCKIVEITTSKPGKHGHAKATILAVDVLTGEKLEEKTPTGHNVDVPVVKRTEWQVVSVDQSGGLTVIDDQGNTRDNVEADDEHLDVITGAMDEGDKNVFIAMLSAPEGSDPEKCKMKEIVVEVRVK